MDNLERDHLSASHFLLFPASGGGGGCSLFGQIYIVYENLYDGQLRAAELWTWLTAGWPNRKYLNHCKVHPQPLLLR